VVVATKKTRGSKRDSEEMMMMLSISQVLLLSKPTYVLAVRVLRKKSI
jgi:hypothetical protein